MKLVEDGLWVIMTNIRFLGCCNHVYPVGTLQIRLPLAQFQDFLVALIPLNACTLIHELRTSTGVNVSYQTIHNRLRTRNLRPRCPAVRIPLTRRHSRLRLDWCLRHLRTSVVDCLLFGLIMIQFKVYWWSKPCLPPSWGVLHWFHHQGAWLFWWGIREGMGSNNV
jgi:hypothetical protein